MNHFYSLGLLDSAQSLLLSLLLGALFGFWLERAGFGSSKKLTAIFYFEDFAVLKVMFAAMATAALVLAGLHAGGKLDLNSLYVPATRYGPQALGGLIFGAGFLLGGWCPGTAAVGLASGRIDALLFLGGAGLGSLGYALLPHFAATSDACGSCGMHEWMGISPLAGAVVLLAVALAAFAAAETVERRKRTPA